MAGVHLSIWSRAFAAFLPLIFTLCLAMAPATAATKLRITSQLPPNNTIPKNLYRFKELVEKTSKGEIQIEVFDSAQLFRDKEVPKAVASGAIDMGSVPLTRFSGTTPIVELFFSPFVFESFDAVIKATQPGHRIRTTIETEVAKTGARILWWQPFGMAVMLSKGEPIDTPAKMKGKKVRAFGKGPGAFVRALGGAPTVMSGSEQFLAYQRGTVDAGMTAITAIKSRKLYDVMDYTIRTNHAVAEFVVVINDRVWRNLSAAQRKILQTAASQAEREITQSYARTEADVLDWIRNNTKMKVIDLTARQHKAFRDASASVIDDFVREAGPIGRELVEEARKLQ